MRRHQTIFVRLLVAFVGVGMAVSLPLIYLSFELNSGSTARRAQQSALQQLSIAAAQFDQNIAASLRRTIRAAELSPTLDTMLTSADAERRILGKRLESEFMRVTGDDDRFTALFLVAPDGRVQVGVADRRRNALAGFGLDRSANEHPQQNATQAAMIELFERIKAAPTMLSSGNMEWFMPPREMEVIGPFPDEAGRWSMLGGIAKIDPDTGVLGAVIMVRQRLDRFLGQLKLVRFFDENSVWLLGRDGRVLIQPASPAASFDPRAHMPQDGALTPRLVLPNEGLLVFQDLSFVANRPAMRIAIAVSSALLKTDLRPTIQLLVVALLASMAFVLVVAALVSRLLSRPIVELATAASRLAAGELSTRVSVSAVGEVGILVSAFNRMSENLQEASAQQKRFVSIAAHELRTPLTIIDGAAQRIRRTAGDVSAAELRERSDRIRVAVARMAQVIDTVLNLARLDEGRIEIQPKRVDLGALVIGVCKRFESIAEGFEIEVDAGSLPLWMSADPRLLDHVFTNLISNAVKYSGASRRIEVGVRSDGGRARVSVRDYGIGIPDDEVARLFGRFFRASNAKGLSGTGIGLNLVQSLVQMHGGDVRVESRLGQGTVFTVELPIDARDVAGAEWGSATPEVDQSTRLAS